MGNPWATAALSAQSSTGKSVETETKTTDKTVVFALSESPPSVGVCSLYGI